MTKTYYSVVIPTYRREPALVLRSVQSIEAQTNQNYEILLVDDNINGSDYSNQLQKVFEVYPKLKYIKQEGNQGACAARNLGIFNAQYDYIGFLDDDDTWEPEKAEKQLALFSDPMIGMVTCPGYIVNENTNGSRKDYYTKSIFKEEVTFEDLLVSDSIGSTSQAMVRRACFDRCGGFDVSLRARQDYEMWLRISKHYRILGVDEQLFTHYIHNGEQITGNPMNSYQGFKRVYHLYHNDYLHNKAGHRTILRWLSNSAKKARRPLFFYYRIKLFIISFSLKE